MYSESGGALGKSTNKTTALQRAASSALLDSMHTAPTAAHAAPSNIAGIDFSRRASGDRDDSSDDSSNIDSCDSDKSPLF